MATPDPRWDENGEPVCRASCPCYDASLSPKPGFGGCWADKLLGSAAPGTLCEPGMRRAYRVLRSTLEGLLPGSDLRNRQGVDWGCSCGRIFLFVADVAVAMEGDVNRDAGGVWTGDQIKAVVERVAQPIRAALGGDHG